MLNINRADVEQMVKIIDYILENEDKVSVEKLMADCGLTFEEYRLMSALAMPAIRQHADVIIHKHRAAFYKGRYNHKLKEAEMLLKKYQDGGMIDESDLHLLAAGEREDFVSASYQGDDGEEGHPEEWAI